MSKGSPAPSGPTAAQSAATVAQQGAQQQKDLLDAINSMTAKGQAAQQAGQNAQMKLQPMPQLSFEDLLGQLGALTRTPQMQSLIY